MSQKARILVVDDEPIVCRNCLKILAEDGYEVETLQSSRTALERVKEEFFDVAIIDLRMPGLNGMELLRLIKGIRPEIVMVMITAYSTVENAVESMKLGAFDYISKPFTPDELSLRVERALEKGSLVQENRYLRQELKVRMTNEGIVEPEHLPLNIQENKVTPVMNIAKSNEELKKLKKQVKEEAVKNVERLFVIEALKRNNWNITKAAEDVGMKRRNFQTLLKKHQINSVS